MLVLEQFLYSLPENLRIWVWRHQPSTVDAAMKLTEEYLGADFPRREGQPHEGQDWGRKLRDPTLGKGLKKKKEEPRGVSRRPA